MAPGCASTGPPRHCRWRRWGAPWWRDAQAATAPPKPERSRHATSGVPHRQRWPRRRVPPASWRPPCGGRPRRLPPPLRHRPHPLALRRAGRLARPDKTCARLLPLVAHDRSRTGACVGAGVAHAAGPWRSCTRPHGACVASWRRRGGQSRLGRPGHPRRRRGTDRGAGRLQGHDLLHDMATRGEAGEDPTGAHTGTRGPGRTRGAQRRVPLPDEALSGPLAQVGVQGGAAHPPQHDRRPPWRSGPTASPQAPALPAWRGSLARGSTGGPRPHGAPRRRPVPARGLTPHPRHAAGTRCPSLHTPHRAAWAMHRAWRGARRAHRGAWRCRVAPPTRGPAHPLDSAAPPPAPPGGMRCAQPPQRPRPPGAPSPGGAHLEAWAPPRPPLSPHLLDPPPPRTRARPLPAPLPALPRRPRQAPRAMALPPQTLAACGAYDVGHTGRPAAAAHGGWPPGRHPLPSTTSGGWAPPPRLRVCPRAPRHACSQGLARCGTPRHGVCWRVYPHCLAGRRVHAEGGAGRPWPTDGGAWRCAAAQAAARPGASASRGLPVGARSPPW